MPAPKSLFFLDNTALCGGSRVLLEIASRLEQCGQTVDIFVRNRDFGTEWFERPISVLDYSSIEEALQSQDYDFLFFGHSFLIPLALPHKQQARPVLICQAYEGFCNGKSYTDSFKDSPSFTEVLKLPIEIVAISRSIQSLLMERLQRHSHYVPIAIDEAFFSARTRVDFSSQPKRILMVGDYLLPLKGMFSGFTALEKLSQEMPIQLVLISQEKRASKIFKQYSFPVELHYRPSREQIPHIYSSCHVYCCTSWYEGLGLPALEAFASGTPVVSTPTYGVSDYGVDGVTLLLTEPDSSDDIYRKLKEALTDEELSKRLAQNAGQRAKEYRWETCIHNFIETQDKILATGTYDATRFQPDHMQRLLEAMKGESILGPVESLRIANYATYRLEEITTALRNKHISSAEGIEQLRKLESQIQQRLADSPLDDPCRGSLDASYHLCRMLIALRDNESDLQSAVRNL